jgi:hypothetical protein
MSIENFISKLEIGPAWCFHNLTVYSLIGPRDSRAFYLTLHDALQSVNFRVEEVSSGGCVPELKVINELPKPVLLLDGEELIGAKKNRILNLTIMAPAKREVTIPVSCVEAGRWHPISETFKAADRTQFARGRAKKLAQVSHSMTASGFRHSDQIDVWSEIDLKRARLGAKSATGAMASIFENSQAELNAFITAMRTIGRQIGAVFLINGKIAGVDVFDASETFAKLASKLVRSYAIDALDAQDDKARNEAAVTPEIPVVRSFLEQTAAASTTTFNAVGLGNDLRLKSNALSGAALEVSGQVIHLVAFPADFFANSEGRSVRLPRMVQARIRRNLH